LVVERIFPLFEEDCFMLNVQLFAQLADSPLLLLKSVFLC
jgi:hypothetical protein